MITRARQTSYLRRVALFATLFSVSALAVQAQETRSLVTQPVDPSHLTELRGNTHPMALAKYDHGAAPTGLPMAHLQLILQRTPEQESALAQLLAEQQDRSSANYHKWLTPNEFGAKFGASEQDIHQVSGWLESQGFHVNQVSNGRTMIDFSGTAGAVQSAFHTTIHKYIYANGEEHWANATNPEIPAALASIVIGVNRLNNFRPKRMSHNLGAFRKSLNTGKTTRVNPQFTESNAGCYGSGTNCYAVGPYDFAKIYNVTPLWTAGTTGSGQTIAVISDSDVVTSDYTQFRSIFGLPAVTLNRVLPTGTNPGVQNCNANFDEEEAILDVEWSGAVAPGATIDLVISPTGGDNCLNLAGETGFDFGGDYSAQYVVDNNTAGILSDSYGECEYGLGTAENAFYAKLWQQAASQGITVSVATGDSGSAGCDYYDLSSGQSDLVEPADYGLAVNGTASTPYNIAVGGTDFYYSNFDNPGQYWSSSNTTGGTTSTLSALGYIPEMAWNDSCADFVIYQGLISGLPDPGNAEAACNNTTLQGYNLVGPAGGSGGASSCISAPSTNGSTQSGCSGGYAKPSWQTGAGVPSDGVRDIPDVSLFAGDGEISGSFYAECEADLESDEGFPAGQPCSTTVQSSDGESYVEVEGVGGTSASAQVFAGAMALLDQKQGRQGNLNPLLYALAASETASTCSSASPASTCIFHDVTAGTNEEPCDKGTPNCTVSKSGDSIGVLTGYAAGTGFDLATGLGTPNVSNFVSSAASLAFYLSSPSTAVTIPSGGTTGTITVDAAAVQNFSGQISSFTCTGLPSGATCAASQPISLTGSGTTGSTTLTITLATAAANVTPAPIAPSNIANRFTITPSMIAFGATILGLLALGALYTKPRRRFVTAFALAAFGLLVMTSACGGGGSSSGGGGGGGTTGTSYTVTVTGATSTGTPASTLTFTLTVD